MTTKQDFGDAKPAMEAMESLLKRGLGEQKSAPLQEFVGGGYEQAIEYARVEREKYVGEVGKRDGNYVYHFWPRTVELTQGFSDKLGDAFIEVFKYPERIAAKHDEVVRCFEGEQGAQPGDILCRFWGKPEDFAAGVCPNCNSKNFHLTQSSWAVRVTGYANNPLADELASSVFDKLDKMF